MLIEIRKPYEINIICCILLEYWSISTIWFFFHPDNVDVGITTIYVHVFKLYFKKYVAHFSAIYFRLSTYKTKYSIIYEYIYAGKKIVKI